MEHNTEEGRSLLYHGGLWSTHRAWRMETGFQGDPQGYGSEQGERKKITPSSGSSLGCQLPVAARVVHVTGYVLWKQMLRGSSVCRIFVRHQYLWRKGARSKIGPIEKLNYDAGQTTPWPTLLGAQACMWPVRVVLSELKWLGLYIPPPSATGVCCPGKGVSLGERLFAANGWDKSPPEGGSGRCISVSTRVHTAREGDSQGSWRRARSSAKNWCSFLY